MSYSLLLRVYNSMSTERWMHLGEINHRAAAVGKYSLKPPLAALLKMGVCKKTKIVAVVHYKLTRGEQ